MPQRSIDITSMPASSTLSTTQSTGLIVRISVSAVSGKVHGPPSTASNCPLPLCATTSWLACNKLCLAACAAHHLYRSDLFFRLPVQPHAAEEGPRLRRLHQLPGRQLPESCLRAVPPSSSAPSPQPPHRRQPGAARRGFACRSLSRQHDDPCSPCSLASPALHIIMIRATFFPRQGRDLCDLSATFSPSLYHIMTFLRRAGQAEL